jgi:hypothetical protein
MRFLNGVQGVEGSNPLAPTKKANKFGGLSNRFSAVFVVFARS